jgi:ArsR family transcriptional regulator, arsenate/arsenite/antimonite-responsive transcriptional repressor
VRVLKCLMGKAEKKFDIERFFVALSDKTRLRLLNLMGPDEVCVCFLVEILGVGQSKISRHLSYLRQTGIVAARREGKWIHYRIVTPRDPYAAKVLEDVLEWLKADKEMQNDRKRLVKFCCASTEVPEHLIAAPRPALALAV